MSLFGYRRFDLSHRLRGHSILRKLLSQEPTRICQLQLSAQHVLAVLDGGRVVCSFDFVARSAFIGNEDLSASLERFVLGDLPDAAAECLSGLLVAR
jgi:hypothetical protein